MATENYAKPITQVARATELTSEVAAKAAAAVEELQRASRMATMVARVATAVAQNTQLSDLTEAVLDQTIGALGAYACSIFVADTHARELHLISSRQIPSEIARPSRTVPFDAWSLLSRVARSRAIEVIDDLRELESEPADVKEFLARTGARRIIGVPLVAADQLIGVLVFILKEPESFGVDDRAVLEVIGSIVGVGLANALAQDRLAREHTRLATILEHAPHGIVYIDYVDDTVSGNPASEQILGMTISGSPHQPPVRLFRPDGTAISDPERPANRARQGEKVLHEEVLIESADGTRHPVLESAVPVIGPRGTIDGVVLAFEDISVLKELERLREEFAAIVAHDLRNPISAILMTAEMMLGKSTGDQVLVRTSLIERVRHAASQLGEMVKDLLDASRVEIGRLSLARKPLDPVEAVKELVTRIQPTLGAHPVDVEAKGPRVCIDVDPLRLDQILTNLLENAAKYSADGSPIHVRVRPADQGIEVSIADRGIGIPADELPLLFDRFYQSRRARQMRKGLGLGLYITKGLIEAHGGRITVDSDPGHGSTFRIWLPFQPGTTE
jgi:PAS domain S-box-containing protein